MIDIHPTARVSRLADIEDSVRGTRIVIGPEAMIDAFVKIKPAGGEGDVLIGRGSYINSGCVIYSGNGVSIGEDCAIAANCTFAATNHEYSRRDLTIKAQRFRPSKGGIVLEDDVWIGANCVILDGALLRRGCVIGAGSVVRGEIPAYSIHVGNPLRLVGWRE
jgi:acetyltransferase-like isoleucine patch superfamily enzyme